MDNSEQNHSSHDPENGYTGRCHHEELGDFTATPRMLPISALAIGIGVLCAYVALALLRLIGFFTNLFYYGQWGSKLI